MDTPSPSGRLRLQFALLKKSPARLAGVCDALRAVGGVAQVDASVAHGSIVIAYDGAAGASHRFWDDVEAVLEYHHLYHDGHDGLMDHGQVAPPNPVQRLVRRSARVLAAVLR